MEAFALLGLGSIAGLIIVFCIFNFFWAILSAILANRYGRNPWSWFFLSGLWGLFGFLFFVLQMGWGFSIISGALALTMFNLPILVRVIQQALEAIPDDQREGGLALGASRWETTIHVLMPAALPAIITGVILSAGRVFGEAAALIYTAGQSAPSLDFTNFDLSSPSCPWNIFRPAETLAVHIWKINSEGVVPDLDMVSNGTAAVLMVCILLFNLLARFFGRMASKKVSPE